MVMQIKLIVVIIEGFLGGRDQKGGGRLFEFEIEGEGGGRLLNFSALRMGTYSRWALI